ncbi:tetratricopeptide repeat protein [Archangium gephyra]|uniref:tetratricopeptide repeat protein n=1 Tax=Archangium gephyra TaxID=48 RepID=UPI003B778FFF
MFHRSLLLLLLLLPLSTWAAQLPGIRLYQRGEYAKASRTLKQEINNPRRTDEQRALARVYLAASLLALEKEDEAFLQLEELARTYPEQRVDPALFPPELVDLELKVRAQIEVERRRQEAEQAELNRIAAQEDAERRRREQEQAARDQLAEMPRDEVPGPAPVEPSSSALRLRPEVTGFVDMLGQGSRGFGVGATLGFGALDTSARLLPGPEGRWGLSLDVGYLFGRGMFQPRVGLRGTGVLGVGVGGGAVVGVRLTPLPWFTWLLDVGIEKYRVRVSDQDRFRDVTLVASTGLGFNLF